MHLAFAALLLLAVSVNVSLATDDPCGMFSLLATMATLHTYYYIVIKMPTPFEMHVYDSYKLTNIQETVYIHVNNFQGLHMLFQFIVLPCTINKQEGNREDGKSKKGRQSKSKAPK